jgi:uncharacterized protein YjbJ (UPF0337 family)
MDENRIAGTAKNMGGKIEEGFGRVTGDTKTQAEGIANRAVAPLKIYTAKSQTPRQMQPVRSAILPHLSRNGSVTRLKRSHIRPPLSQWVLVGFLADCTGRFEA